MKAKTGFTKLTLSLILALALTVGIAPGSVLAADLANNPAGSTVDEIAAEDYMGINEGTVTVNNGEIATNNGTVATHNGWMSYNYGTITANNGEVLDNPVGGIIEDNGSNGCVQKSYGNIIANNGEIKYNYGTVTENNGTVEDNYGTVTENNSTVTNNYCSTVNGGTVINNYVYKINVSSTAVDSIAFYGEEDDDVRVVGNDTVYVKENVVVTIETHDGYIFTEDGAPKITEGNGIITYNEDGYYTLTDITGNITLTATVAVLPAEDIMCVPTTAYVGIDIDLSKDFVVIPEGASTDVYWEIVDAGTTGAVIDDPYSGILSSTGEGTLKIKAVIENGKSETEDFTKEFTITVKDAVKPVYNAYTPLKAALTGGSLAELKTAAAGFESVLEVYNAFSEELLSELATKLGISSSEEAYYTVLGDWINTNVVIKMDNLYQEYLDAPNEETKSAFVEYYDSVFNDAEYEDQNLRALVRTFISDIDDVYGKATGKETVSAPAPTPTPTPDTTSDQTLDSKQTVSKEAEGQKSPQTGDNTNLWLWFAVAFISGGGLFGTVIYKKKQEEN